MNEARPFQFEDEDTRLMIQAAAGDRTAYERIYGKYHGTVVAYVKARKGRHGPCEDLVQEVFTRVWRTKGSVLANW
jgi:DNA-directed RNA polymerase specialized sigma24 family protein